MTTDRLHSALKTEIPGCAWLLRFDLDGIAYPGTTHDLEFSTEFDGGQFYWLHLDLSDARVGAFLTTHSIFDPDIKQELLGPIDHQLSLIHI